MRLLLDTHAFLWWLTDAPQLSKRARTLISNERNEVFFSAASAWEIVIKAQLGRLTLPERVDRFILRQLEVNNFQGLPIRMEHALRLQSLQGHHRDPFDRMLVAQALEDGLIILTADPLVRRYRVRVAW
jgi:PIN domain nuclease of toxin-antitoxin system